MNRDTLTENSDKRELKISPPLPSNVSQIVRGRKQKPLVSPQNLLSFRSLALLPLEDTEPARDPRSRPRRPGAARTRETRSAGRKQPPPAGLGMPGSEARFVLELCAPRPLSPRPSPAPAPGPRGSAPPAGPRRPGPRRRAAADVREEKRHLPAAAGPSATCPRRRRPGPAGRGGRGAAGGS